MVWPECIWNGRTSRGTMIGMKRSLFRSRKRSNRRGAGSLEFVLVLGVILPLVGIALPMTRKMSQRVYEMTSTLISWPFL